MAIRYDRGNNKYKNWIVSEDEFKKKNLGKFETLFSLGNGYLGIRGATEEHYLNETRGCYIAGLFDSFDDEVTELPNIPDWLGLKIILAGEEFSLRDGEILSYDRHLNLKDGCLERNIVWESPEGRKTRLEFSRFVSFQNIHLSGLKFKLKPLNYAGKVKIKSGFDGRVTNSGTQHLKEGEKRVFDDKIYYLSRTQDSDILLVQAAGHRYKLNNILHNLKREIVTDRRQLFIKIELEMTEGSVLEIEKIVSTYTSRDKEVKKGNQVLDKALNLLTEKVEKGYDKLFEDHGQRWQEIWDIIDIKIDGPDFDQLALRFAVFHIMQMTPFHDEKISIAAKGLTGEGYKGHVFWDTEIFIFPFFLYTQPEVARSLLKYRYHTLDGARQKARENGYQGAMFAWESAETGLETTPRYGAVDVKTGKPIRIWSGDIEQHITADIAYAVWQYYQVTGDRDFLLNYGAEIIIETARFWASRVDYNPIKYYYEIKDVIGPDEYKEHVDNNAYTNYLAKWNLNKAVEVAEELESKEAKKWTEIRKKLSINSREIQDWQEIAKRLFVPGGNRGFIPQFEGFMDLPEIDLNDYKNRDNVGSIVKDLGWKKVTSSQVLKQADVVMLLYLLRDRFSKKMKKINWDYYEPITLHDSSLSPAVHAIVARDIGLLNRAYDYFQKALRIDLGKNMNSSDAGLHAASLGGIWQAVINGFAGIRVNNGRLIIDPLLPEKWKGLNFHLFWQGIGMEINITEEKIEVKADRKSNINIIINKQEYNLKDSNKIQVKY